MWPSNFVGGLYYAAFKATGPINKLKWTVTHHADNSKTFVVKKGFPMNCTNGETCEKVWLEREIVSGSFKVSNFFQDGFFYSMFKVHERIGSNFLMSLKFSPNAGYSTCSINDIYFIGCIPITHRTT